MVRRALAGEKLVPIGQAIETLKTTPAGHVSAVLGMARQLGIPDLLSSRPSRERDLVLGMIVERLLHPASKLATTRQWGTTTLASELGIEDAKVAEVYAALDWVLERQPRIEKKLAARHLSKGGLALYDLSNSHYHGTTCELARLGHAKDGGHGVAIIAYGVMTDRDGRPVSIEVYPGNTSDSKTVVGQVLKLRLHFDLQDVVLVGDRGTLTSAQVRRIKEHPGLGWITALRSEAIRKLVDGHALQLSLFDKVNLAEIKSPDFPNERLVACFNPLLAEDRRRKRRELLDATEKLLAKVAQQIARRTKTPLTAGEIGEKVGRVVNRHKVAKHFDVQVGDGRLVWTRKQDAIRREEEMDGLYIVRTSVPAERLSAEDTVRGYKLLADVEQGFRCLKGIDLRAAPIFLANEDHVRAHYFICLLAYYVEWHMRRALAPLLFQDEELPASRPVRDPVLKPTPSESVKAKKKRKLTPDDLPVQSFGTLLTELGTQCRVTYRVGDSETTFDQLARPTPLQQRALELLAS
jgi:hypothetical protein